MDPDKGKDYSDLDVKIDPFAYGTTTKTRAQILGTVPTVESEGTEVAALPHAFDGHFSVGDNKNVSTPVSGN